MHSCLCLCGLRLHWFALLRFVWSAFLDRLIQPSILQYHAILLDEMVILTYDVLSGAVQK
uniref:Secreted protein n=1 Tax=Arundo donax TaxID=35708 RepID=A0A0A9D5T2_ARUDO